MSNCEFISSYSDIQGFEFEVFREVDLTRLSGRRPLTHPFSSSELTT